MLPNSLSRFLTPVVALSLWLAVTPAWAGSMLLLGAGNSGAAGTSFQGVGDVVSGATTYWSCARVYNAADASTSTNLCDLVAVTGGAAVCTLRGSSSGFVDLTAYCPGTLTPAAACAAASGGSCKVKKAYNQVTPGTLDATQATLANMPALAFSSINSLPAIVNTAANSQFLGTSATITQALPYSMSVVVKNTSSANAGGYVSFQGDNIELRDSGGSSDTMVFNCGSSGAVGETATDNAFHAMNSTCAVADNSSAVRIDATDNTGVLTTNTSPSALGITLGKSSGASFGDSVIAEAAFYPLGFTAPQRSSVNANQHGTNGYNF